MFELQVISTYGRLKISGIKEVTLKNVIFLQGR